MVSTSFSPAISQRPQPVRFTAQPKQFVSQQPPMTFQPMALPEDTILSNLRNAIDQIGKPKSNLSQARLKMYG